MKKCTMISSKLKCSIDFAIERRVSCIKYIEILQNGEALFGKHYSNHFGKHI